MVSEHSGCRRNVSATFVNGASAMAKASSTPGSVSMMSLRGGGDAGVDAGDAVRVEEASTGALVCVVAGDAIRVEEASTRASMSVVDECRRAYGEDS
jgi:hypothetical protein